MSEIISENLKHERKYIFFGAIDKTIRDMFFEDRDKADTLILIILNTNFQEQYKGLDNLQSYFSYSIFEKVLNIKRTKLQRIIRELEDEEFIDWVSKSKSRHEASIIALNYQYGKGYGRKYSKEYGKNTENTGVTVGDNIIKNTVKDTLNNTLSKNISKNISILNNKETVKVINLNNKILNCYKYYINANITQFELDELIRLGKEYGDDFLERAIIELSKRSIKSFKYIISLLEDWRSKGFRTIEEVEIALIKRGEENKKRNENLINSNPKKSSNNDINPMSFNNFEAREYDYDKLEKRLLGWDKEVSENNYTSNNSKRISKAKLSLKRIKQIEEHERLLLESSMKIASKS